MNPKKRIYELVHGDEYRRQKLKQGEGDDLMIEWDPDDEKQIHTTDELIEFLNGRIDGLLLAWEELTGWRMGTVGQAVHEAQDDLWRANEYDWIDLSVVDHQDGEMQCPWCGDIYHADDLLWLLPRGAMDDGARWPVCDDCAPRHFPRDAVAEAESRRADQSGGQKPLDGNYK